MNKEIAVSKGCMPIDIGNECTECRRDTSFGSGLFVNRIPADRQDGVDDELIIGYLCPECQLETCEECGEETLEYEMTEGGTILCDDCYIELEEEYAEV